MLVAGFDTETSGLTVTSDHIIQGAVVLWDTSSPVKKAKVKFDSLIKCPNIPQLDPAVIAIHGITNQDLELYGNSPEFVYKIINGIFEKADAIVAHNGNLFDRPMYEHNCLRHAVQPVDKLWIDTTCDIEFPPTITTRKLVHLAAEHGFVNPFPHDALSDVLTMLKIADCYDWGTILKYAQCPSITLRADVTFQQKELAKKQSFRWDADNKFWVKTIKEFQLDDARKLANDAGFKVTVLKGGK